MHVALIAMSGVRAANPELTRVGLTLPGFVERSRVIASMPSLSLLTLAALTPDRVEVSYHEVRDLAEVDELPGCDLAAISTMTAQAKDAYELSRRFRAAGVRTVLGGLHATAVPDEAGLHFDAVVVGEGEPVWPRLVADAERGRLAARYGPSPQFDLRDSPVPRFDLLELERYNRIPVQTQRGCPWRCEFCASSITIAPRYRVKPVARVVDEIRAVKALWRRPFVELADDNTFVNRRHSKELLRALAEEGPLRWFTETDVAVADDEELLSLLRAAGCVQVLVGLESPTAAALEGVERRRDWKHGRFESYRRAIERIQSHGIAVNGCFVLGLDGTTPADFAAVARFVEETGLQEVQITVQTPFPGTPLYARLDREGRLLRPGAWELCTLFDVNFRPDGMTVAELERGLIDLARHLYSAEEKERRRRAFLGHVRAARRGRRAEVDVAA